ncbi:phosphatase PAP2 family protein [Candidatus Gracilibacteria bacterium]|nr:phosphatase PAP2 family protein [Candidatus Gracilibacteria bacterium]
MWDRYRFIGYILLIGLSTDIFIGEIILKHIFNRLRPFQELNGIVLKIPEPITSSFPSGHTSVSICFAIIFTYFFWIQTKYGVISIWILAIGVTLSRFYLQVHYPTDILAGIGVGIICSVLAILLYIHTSKFSISK